MIDNPKLPLRRRIERRPLTAEQFRRLAEVPPETEWYANIKSAGTRRIYRIDIRDSGTSRART
jgi:hypothetical protein